MMVVKTGYVTDAAQLERVDADGTKYREWLEGQWMTNHFVRVAETAAKYRVAFDSHEPVKGTGLHRTYPNWVAREGMRGMEYNSWPGKNPPEHEANLVFTRMLEGPMDFTPGVLSLQGEGRQRHPLDHCQAARALCGDLFAGADGGGYARKLRQVSRRRSNSSATCRPTGGNPRAEWRDRRLRHHRAQTARR